MKSNKPKILVFSDWYLPGHRAGGPITSMANLFRNLATYVEFKLVCSDRDYMTQEPYEHIIPNTWIKRENIEVLYLSPQQLSKTAIKNIIKQHPGYTIYINGIFSKYFSVTPLIEANKLNRNIIVAPRGMFAPGALSIKANKKRMFLNLAKFMGWYRRVRFHATKEEEAKQIQKIVSTKSKITVIPNFPNLPSHLELGNKTKVKNQISIISVARIAKEKNTLFALQCLNQIPEHIELKMSFIGPVYDKAYYQKCNDFAAGLPASVHVEFKGNKTPAEIHTEWKKHHLFFLPTLGENYGHAIIEALLNGLPVLISNKTPWQKLKDENLGADFLLTSTQPFTEFIINIAQMNQDEYEFAVSEIHNKAKAKVRINEMVEAYKLLFQ